MDGARLVRRGWAAFWALVLLALGLLDLHRDRKRDGSTFSEANRWARDRVPEPWGRLLFAAIWWRFAWWYWRHIDRR